MAIDMATLQEEKVLLQKDFEEMKKDPDFVANYDPVSYEGEYYGDDVPKGKEFKLTIGIFESDTFDIFQEISGVSEKKGKDHDGDGDVDKDDYMAAKDKAIKKAMGKDVDELAVDRKGNPKIDSEPSRFKGRDKSKIRGLKEGRGDMDILLGLIKDRATESGFSEDHGSFDEDGRRSDAAPPAPPPHAAP